MSVDEFLRLAAGPGPDRDRAAEAIIRRDGERCMPAGFDGLGETIALPLIGCELALADIYRNVALADREAP